MFVVGVVDVLVSVLDVLVDVFGSFGGCFGIRPGAWRLAYHGAATILLFRLLGYWGGVAEGRGFSVTRRRPLWPGGLQASSRAQALLDF